MLRARKIEKPRIPAKSIISLVNLLAILSRDQIKEMAIELYALLQQSKRRSQILENRLKELETENIRLVQYNNNLRYQVDTLAWDNQRLLEKNYQLQQQNANKLGVTNGRI